MTTSQKSAGHNWSGILIALIGAATTLGGTWLTIQYAPQSAAAVPTANEMRVEALPALDAAPSVSASSLVVPATSASGVVQLSTASEPVTVPLLSELPLAQAREQLAGLGLVVAVQETPAADPAGTIVGVDPAPGSSVMRGATITVKVSAGVTATVDAKHPKGKHGR